MRPPREREMRLKVDAPLVMLPRQDPVRQAPAADWSAPCAHGKAALWYQQVLGWCIVPAHYLLNWQDSGIYVCSCGDHATCLTPGKHPNRPWRTLEEALPADELRRAWMYGKRPPWNLSLLTGSGSGVIMADLDA